MARMALGIGHKVYNYIFFRNLALIFHKSTVQHLFHCGNFVLCAAVFHSHHRKENPWYYYHKGKC